MGERRIEGITDREVGRVGYVAGDGGGWKWYVRIRAAIRAAAANSRIDTYRRDDDDDDGCQLLLFIGY